jgi:hypothetical protein
MLSSGGASTAGGGAIARIVRCIAQLAPQQPAGMQASLTARRVERLMASVWAISLNVPHAFTPAPALPETKLPGRPFTPPAVSPG